MPEVYDIQFRVVETDVRSYATDVLVLKYAQASYGVDSHVAIVCACKDAREVAQARFAIKAAPARLTLDQIEAELARMPATNRLRGSR